MKGILVFAASGPVLLLSSYDTIDDPQLMGHLQAKGMEKFLAWEVPIARCHELYGYTYRDDAADLETHKGIHVLDNDGHRIFLNFALSELRGGIVYEHGAAGPLR